MSQHERMILKEIEEDLTRQDPLLAARLARDGRSWVAALPALATAGLGFALGIVMMAVGATSTAPAVAWAGVAVAGSAPCWLLVSVARLLSGRRHRR